uniref:PCI domain-containing protein n=1 Tax=Steinernema glaseri TaxID=37863 RepID=A0A1I7ZZ30_9BILA
MVAKERHAALISMCAERDVIPLEDIAKKVDLPLGEELEEFLIAALRSDEIKATIDERAGILHVTSYLEPKFGDDQWKQLSQTIDAMLERIAKASEYIEECIEQCRDSTLDECEESEEVEDDEILYEENSD